MALRKLLFVFAGVLFAFAIKAQPGFTRADTVEVEIGGNPLKNSWAGGINFAQFSQIDLNMDGTKDLFVFDRSGNRISTWINNGTPNTVDYTYAPQYIASFPPLHDWALLADYNCDGKEDIFAYSDVAGGFKVYKNTSTATTLQFQLATPLIYSNYFPNMANLYVSSVDIPTLIDIDNDTDLDILTFWVLGTYVEYHKNMSMELYGTCDSLKFQVQNRCWGYFSENASNNLVNLNDTCGGNVNNPEKIAAPGERHTGSTLLSFDQDGDGDKELLLGDISATNMLLLNNDGTITNNHIGSYDPSYPSYDTPINVTLFPAAFHLDVDNDGRKDIIVAPNAANVSENFTSVFFYKNTGSGSNVTLSYVENDMLQEEMIETGEGAYPTFFDYNSDGLLDLIIANYSYYATGPDVSKVSLYKNIGTSTDPKFSLITRDYASLSSLNLLAVVPAFGDLDNDGDKDMIVGDYNGHMHYYQNTAGTGNPANFVLAQANMTSIASGAPIDVGSFATPQIIDIDRDGKKDLLLGARSGKLAYYRNTSASGPVLDSITHFFGGVNVTKVNSSTGYSVPWMYDQNGSYRILVGSESGYIYQYNNIDNNLNGTFSLLDSTFMDLREGMRTAPSLANINSDTLPDMVIGNYAGGVSLFMGDATTGISPISYNKGNMSIYPNPAGEYVNIHIASDKQGDADMSIYTVLGQEVMRMKLAANINTQVAVNDLPAGMYYCRIILNNTELVRKFIVQH